MLIALLFSVGEVCSHAAGPHPADAGDDLARLLPGQVSGWAPVQEDELYTADELYRYINGSAEIYRSLHVRRVLVRRYQKSGMPDIVADIFGMNTDADAFGAYHHDIRDGENAGIGNESEYSGSTLSFWKGRYFVCVRTPKPSEEARNATVAAGRSIAAAIKEEGKPPALARLLPSKDLKADSVKYFHDHLLLNLYYYISDENLLNLGADTEGVTGRYRTDSEGAAVCVLVRYAKKAAAELALKDFLSGYLPEADTDGTCPTEDSKWAGARTAGDLLAVVFDAPTRAAADCLLNKATQHAEAQHD